MVVDANDLVFGKKGYYRGDFVNLFFLLPK